MRIIAGTLRGRVFLPPASKTTRPITDRVKQSVFDILAPMIDGSRVYDCFSGTGSMGLECLSRGAAEVTFFEADRSALEILRKNIRALEVEQQSTLISGDLFKRLSPSLPPADLIFLDPPYRMLRENRAQLQALATTLAGQLSEAGLVVFRHDSADELDLPPLTSTDRREYGSMTVELLRRLP